MRGLAWIISLIALGFASSAASAATVVQAPNSQREKPELPCRAAEKGDPLGRIYRIKHHRECDASRFTIAVYEEGRFRAAYNVKEEISAADAVNPVIEELHDRAANLGPGEPLRILIFAHGGLVSHASAMRAAEAHAGPMQADGYAPIFLVWNSGLLDSYPDRLCCVRDGERDTNFRISNVTSRLIGDVGASVVRSPQNFGGQALRFRDSVLRQRGTKYYLDLYDDRPENGLCAELHGRACPTIVFPPHDGKTESEREARLNGRGRSVGRELIYTSLFGVRAVSTILLPEAGAKGWDNMVRRTRMSFARSSAPPPSGPDCVTVPDTPPVRNNRRLERQGGFAVFFDRLACEIETGPNGSVLRGTNTPVEISFYGHSMGAFVGNEALRLYPQLPWRDLTFMAAASSMREFLVGAVPTLQKRPAMTFNHLVLHPLNESRELQKGGIAPQGSLLEWIDEMFEGPRSPDERTMGKWSNFESTAHLIPADVRGRTTVRVFAKSLEIGTECGLSPTEVLVASGPCHPIQHGEFDDFTFWRPAYVLARDIK